MQISLSVTIFLIVFFAVLDGLRDTFFPGSHLSYIKDITPLIGFVLVIYKCKQIQSIKYNFNYYIIFNIGLICIITIGLANTVFASTVFERSSELSFGGFSVLIKIISFLFLANFLYLLKLNNPAQFNSIPKIYIFCTLFYCLITFIFVFSGLNTNLAPRNWYGRLSIGYPTMDSFVLVVGLALLQISNFKRRITIILYLIFFLCLIMQNTVSGYLMLFILWFSYLFTLKGVNKLLPIIFFSLAILTLTITYNFYADSLGFFGALIADKINGFIFGADTSSISARREQIAELLHLMSSDIFTLFFGVGGFGAFSVESQLYSVFGFGGIFAVVAYLLFLITIFLKIYQSKNHIFIILLLLYIAGGFSLTALYLYPFIFIISYIFAASDINLPFKKYENMKI